MSDLLAPVLCEIKCEAEAFWCFVGLMQRAIFVCTPTDNDMDNNLVSKSMYSNFYSVGVLILRQNEILFPYFFELLVRYLFIAIPLCTLFINALFLSVMTCYFLPHIDKFA